MCRACLLLFMYLTTIFNQSVLFIVNNDHEHDNQQKSCDVKIVPAPMHRHLHEEEADMGGDNLGQPGDHPGRENDHDDDDCDDFDDHPGREDNDADGDDFDDKPSQNNRRGFHGYNNICIFPAKTMKI